LSTLRHRRAQELFERAARLSGSERSDLLTRECGDDAELRALVEEFLALDELAVTPLDTPALQGLSPESVLARAAERPLPQRIGRFRIVARLGAGGMGIVYEAEQESPRRRVALKVLHAGSVSPEVLRRFQLEAQVLAWLHHPGIATIYETGAVEGELGPEPYVAMELVRGERLDAWAARARPSVRERLELLARVADAVHHAHQKSVVHRDLKPANVLVDEFGQPKVLDFGVARLTGADLDVTTRHTSAGEILGTLAYMSPEQVEGDPSRLDVRADVYALGVIAYELLAGRRPQEVGTRSLPEAIQAIVHEEPTALGQIDRRLRGDVETIVHKALAKERERRYGSAAELAADLRRFLADEPIVARPASRSYQLRKFARRNRALVGGVAAVIVALAAGLVASTRLYLQKEDQRAAAERKGVQLAAALKTSNENLERAQAAEKAAGDEGARARLEAQTASAVTDYLESLFEYASPEHPGSGQTTALEMLDQGVERIRGRFQDRPALRLRLLNVLGRTYNWLERYDRSKPVLEEALGLAKELYGDDRTEVADVLERLAQVHVAAEDLSTAERMQRRVLAIRQEHLAPDDKLISDALENLANSVCSEGDYDQAEKLLLRSHALLVGREGEDGPDVGGNDYNMGVLYSSVGRDREAEEMLSKALDLWLAQQGEQYWRTLICRTALADAERLRGDDAQAVENARKGYEGLLHLFGEDSRMTRTALRIYADCLRDDGQPAKAVPLLEGLVDEGKSRAPSAEYADVLENLASTYQDLKRYDDAEALYLDVLDLRKQLGAQDPENELETQQNLAVLYQQTGRLEKALALEQQVVESFTKALGPAHPDTRGALSALALVYHDMGRPADEERVRRRKLAACEKALGDTAPATFLARRQLASFLEERKEYQEAESLLLGAWKSEAGKADPDLPAALVALYRAWGRPDRAAPWSARVEPARK